MDGYANRIVSCDYDIKYNFIEEFGTLIAETMEGTKKLLEKEFEEKLKEVEQLNRRLENEE
jgi:hypothetical protein